MKSLPEPYFRCEICENHFVMTRLRLVVNTIMCKKCYGIKIQEPEFIVFKNISFTKFKLLSKYISIPLNQYGNFVKMELVFDDIIFDENAPEVSINLMPEQVELLLKEHGYELYNIINGVIFIAFGQDRNRWVNVDIRTNSFRFIQNIGIYKLSLDSCSPFSDKKHFKKMESIFVKYTSKHINDI